MRFAILAASSWRIQECKSRSHGVAEGAIGALLAALPFLLDFASQRRARNLCFTLAGVTAVVSALTDWDKKSERVARRRHRRRPRLVAA
jgi:hypothetical protein